jgi:hypothetical protein
MESVKSIVVVRNLIISTILLTSFLPLNAQPEEMKNLAQFLFPEFTKSILKMKAGKDMTLILNYNIITEKMVFIQKDQVYDFLNPEKVDTVILNSKLFIPVGKVFYEVLLDGQLALYLQNKGKIEEPGKPAAYGGTSQVSSSSYITRLEVGGPGSVYNMKLPEELIIKPDNIFWIAIDNNLVSFTNERQFLKIFPGKETEIKKFIKANRLKFENQSDMISLVTYCRELVK